MFELQKDKERCFLCGRLGTLEEHHIFNAPNRTASETYGLTVNICADCHRLDPKSVHRSGVTARALKHHAQKEAMKFYGWNNDEWCKRFIISYLTEEELNEDFMEGLKK